MSQDLKSDELITGDHSMTQSTAESLTSDELGGTGYMSWLKNTFVSQTTGIWDNIKHDMYEVANAVKNEPISAAERTVNSVYRQISEVAHSLQDGVAPVSSDDSESNAEEIGFPIDDVKSVFTGFVSALEKRITNIKQSALSIASDTSSSEIADTRNAHISVIRADAKTFETIPPAQEGIMSYADWRSAYFDEETCSARPGIPISDGASRSDIAPTHDSPSEVLEKSPIVRTHLLRLVDPDVGSSGVEVPAKGCITEADFWSRYYYRIWLFHGTEMRRHRLTDRVTGFVVGDKVDDHERKLSTQGTLYENIDLWPDLEDDSVKNRAMLKQIPSAEIPVEATILVDSDVIKATENLEVIVMNSDKEASPITISSNPQDSECLESIDLDQSKSDPTLPIVSSPESQSSSIVLVDDDDASTNKSSSGSVRDGWGDDCGINLTEEDVKDAEKVLRLTTYGESHADETSETSDWEKWA